jgi:hypothetical protein
MNKTFALILIFVSSCALCCSRFRSSMTAKSVQSPSVDEQRPVAPASCPVTRAPAVLFRPPGLPEMGKDDNDFFFGTEKLWTALLKSGAVWGWAPRGPDQPDLTAKVFWGSVDYDRHREGNADLKVTGRRLDGDAPPLVANRTTNALGDPYDAMLTGVYMPTPGCWEITGAYKGQKLSFVVWLYPVKQVNQ